MSRIYKSRRPIKKVFKEMIEEFGLKNRETAIHSDDGGQVLSVHIPNYFDARALRAAIPAIYEEYRTTVSYDTGTNPVYAEDG